MRQQLFLYGLVLSLTHCSIASAAIDNRGLMPFGENEIFTGNAGVAGGPSTGAVYYNPAALAQIDHARISVSGSAYVSSSTSTPKFALIDNTAIPYTSSGFDTIPSTVISTFRRGDFTLAYFILVPETSHLENKLTLDTPNSHATLIQVQDDSELWAGVSAATFVGERWSLGASFYLIQRKQSVTVALLYSFPNTANTATTTVQHLQASAYNLGFTLGALHRFSDSFSLGLRLQTPGIRVSGKGTGYTGNQSVSNGTLSNPENSEDNIRATYNLPLDMTLGTRWQPTGLLSVLADLSFQVGTEFDPLPNSAFSSTIKTQGTLRFNTGLLAQVSKPVLLGAGFMVNPSSIHNLDNAEEGSARSSFLGVTGGVYWMPDNVRTGLGVFHLWSSGELIPIGEPTARADFSRKATGAVLTISYLL